MQYPDDFINKIICGDCLEVMKYIPDKSIDAIITDLPYGTTACKWDEIIPFDPMWYHVKRLLKSRGIFITTSKQPFTSKLIMSNLKWFRYCWVWEKAHAANFLVARFMPLIKHEDIVIFYKKHPTYNPQITQGKRKLNRSGIKATKRNKESIYGTMPDNLSLISNTEYQPSSIQFFSAGAMCKRIHPTQKPISLYEYLIYTYTNETNLILDFCIGSGTTAIACINTNRRFIGIDISQEYVDLANARLSAL